MDWCEHHLLLRPRRVLLISAKAPKLHLLRTLRSFEVSTGLLWTFYNTVVASLVCYAIVC